MHREQRLGRLVVFCHRSSIARQWLEAAERLGFHYAGLCPLFDEGHDVLRMQHVNVPIDFSALAVAGVFAREIVDYVQADRARVDAL
jgi:hypothetical protein